MNTLLNLPIAMSFKLPSAQRYLKAFGLIVTMLIGLMAAFPSQAVDFTALGSIGGPLQTALTTLDGMTPGIKALIGFIAFTVALISLAALRNFSPVLFFIGVAIFAATGLVIAGAIMGASVSNLALI